jgi:hypothetical protein
LQFPQLKQILLRSDTGFCPSAFSVFIGKHLHNLETLSLQSCCTLDPLVLPAPLSMLHTLLLDNIYRGIHELHDVHALVANCPHLLRFFAPLFGVSDAVLRLLGAHCPRLQQLHVRLAPTGEGANDIAALLSVLQGCRDLRILELATDTHLTNEQSTALAAHCRGLTAIKLHTIPADIVALVLPSLGSLQHLMVGSFAINSPLPPLLLVSLAAHCRQLRSLSLKLSATQGTEDALVTLFQNLPFLEDISLRGCAVGSVTDVVLRAIGAHCEHLRRLCLSSNILARVVYTQEGIKALQDGCPHLRELSLRGFCVAEMLPRCLRPYVWRLEDVTGTTAFWKIPEHACDTYQV